MADALQVVLGANADPLIKELRRAERDMQKFGKNMEGYFNTIKSVGAGLASVIGVAVAGSMTAMIKQTLDAAGALQDQADILGLNVEKFQALSFAAAQAGVNAAGFEQAMGVLARTLGDAAVGGGEAQKKFSAWGISVRDAQGQTNDLNNVLEQIAQRMQATVNPAERAALANEFFGRSGLGMINVLRDGATGLRTAEQQARDYGAVMSEELVKKGKEASDQLNAMAQVIDTNLKSAFINILPSAREFSDVFKGISVLSETFKPFNERSNDRLLFDQDKLEKIIDNYKKFGGYSPDINQKDQGLLNAIKEARAARAYLEAAQNPRSLVKPTANPLPKLGQLGKSAEVDKLAEYLNNLRQENELLQINERDRAAVKAVMDAENIARREGTVLSEAYRQSVENSAYANYDLKKSIQDTSERMKEMREFSNQLAASMSSGFEDAIIKGSDLRDVLKGILDDIGRIVIRNQITKPLANYLSGGSDGGGGASEIFSFASSLFGGFRAAGGPVSSGKAYVVGEKGPEIFAPNMNGAIVPNSALGGGGNNVVVNVNVTGAQASNQQSARENGAIIGEMVRSTVIDVLRNQQRAGGILY